MRDDCDNPRACGVCHACQRACEGEFCDACATVVALEMQMAWGLNGPQLCLVSDEPPWGTGCTTACAFCGACT